MTDILRCYCEAVAAYDEAIAVSFTGANDRNPFANPPAVSS